MVTTSLHLVRHGRPVIDVSLDSRDWRLDPDHAADVVALRASGRLPVDAFWCTSPEPKARQTARLLTDGPVLVADDLREQDRDGGWVDDFETVVARAFAHPTGAAREGWEPLERCADRVGSAVGRLVEDHPRGALVLVGHATAWTVLLARLAGLPIDGGLLARWRGWRMPDVVAVEDPGGPRGG